ncbi:MAG: 50S ribosomal protein L32 [Actinobacteria bacterium]|nr:MAG: 50S ribosomal protein L32 [Actinomycetota bacterium]
MAVPKQKKTRSKRDMRKSHWKAANVQLAECPQCHEKKLPHHACPNCGYYKGKQVIELEKEKPKKSKEK